MLVSLLHILISFNLFFSSIGIPVFEHICRKQGTITSFYIKSKTCCSKKAKCLLSKVRKVKGPADHHQEFKKQPCCKDLHHFVKNATPGIKQISFVAGKHSTFKNLFCTRPAFDLPQWFAFSSKITFLHYHPPPVILEIYKICRVFRC